MVFMLKPFKKNFATRKEENIKTRIGVRCFSLLRANEDVGLREGEARGWVGQLWRQPPSPCLGRLLANKEYED